MAGRAERVLRRGRQRLEQADVLTELAAPTHEAALESDLGSVALGPLKVSRRPADSD
jgi:hypothetical protein